MSSSCREVCAPGKARMKSVVGNSLCYSRLHVTTRETRRGEGMTEPRHWLGWAAVVHRALARSRGGHACGQLPGCTPACKSDYTCGGAVRVILAYLQNNLRSVACRLAGAERLASRRAQSGDRIAFHQDRTGVVKVIALGRFVRDI